ncbi:hypothetical protein [Alkalibacterium kapii]|uniref:Uncharacterized protein n=1 Tax=Alkalibacterium kapii TaxID=426704 RepID=A0A511ASE7_9LACT|nr:hypothetical protein [Alkalibacterium kapii]GEK91124.1 hypothetical protein AKA01nite_07460 [Alkalibacterium kapii]
MKKFFAYISIVIGGLAALIIVGAFVVMLFQTRLETSNERLALREEERSSIEDKWLAAHENEENITLVIEDVAINQDSGTLKWSDSQERKGLVYFSVESDDSISFAEAESNFPKNMPSYPKYFREAISEKIRN